MRGHRYFFVYFLACYLFVDFCLPLRLIDSGFCNPFQIKFMDGCAVFNCFKIFKYKCVKLKQR